VGVTILTRSTLGKEQRIKTFQKEKEGMSDISSSTKKGKEKQEIKADMLVSLRVS